MTEKIDNFDYPIKVAANMAENKKKYITLLDKVTLASGIVTGILQLESLAGFLSFLTVYLLSCLIYILWICQCRPARFYESIFNDLVAENFMRELLAFIMAWTFSYALVE